MLILKDKNSLEFWLENCLRLVFDYVMSLYECQAKIKAVFQAKTKAKFWNNLVWSWPCLYYQNESRKQEYGSQSPTYLSGSLFLPLSLNVSLKLVAFIGSAGQISTDLFPSLSLSLSLSLSSRNFCPFVCSPLCCRSSRHRWAFVVMTEFLFRP